jgi:hypothetical protein
MALLPTLLRAGVLCLASMIPENSSLDSVVFCASLQILLGVVYVTLFYTVSAMVNVLTSRGALSDPTDVNIDFEGDNLNEFEDENDFAPYSVRSTPHGAAFIVRAGRGVGRQVHRIVSRVTGGDMPSAHRRHEDCDDHSPARRGSVQDISSVNSDTTEESDAAGVGLGRRTKSWVKNVVMPSSVEPDVTHPSLDVPTLDEKRIVKDWAVHNTQPVQAHGDVCRVRLIPEESEWDPSRDHVYTDVYGLGFSAFVLAYTIDCELRLTP